MTMSAAQQAETEIGRLTETNSRLLRALTNAEDDRAKLLGRVAWLESVLAYARARDRYRTQLLKLAMVWVERCAAATRERHFGTGIYYDVEAVSPEDRKAARCTLTKIDEELRA